MVLTRRQALAGLGFGALAGPIGAQAQSVYPSKPIRFVLGFAPGGPTDLLARVVTQKLSESLGVPAVVDSRPGADSIIGTQFAARSAPDGHTVVMISPSAAIHPSVYAKLPYSIVDDFTPVTVMVESSYVLIVNPSVPAKNFKEFIDFAKSRQGKLNYGGAGIGDSLHMAGELLQTVAGFKMQIVTFGGGGPAITALLGGHVEAMISPIAISATHIRAGKLRALAMTAPHRSPVLPDVPTAAESGLPGYAVTGWYALLAPAGTPAPVVEKLSAEIVKVLKQSDTRDKLLAGGMEPLGTTPAEAAAYLKAEVTRWAATAKAANIPPKSF